MDSVEHRKKGLFSPKMGTNNILIISHFPSFKKNVRFAPGCRVLVGESVSFVSYIPTWSINGEEMGRGA